MKKIIHMGLILILCSFVFHENVLGWSVETHETLSLYAAKSSVLSKYKGNYLIKLGLDEGLNKPLTWGVEKEISEWIEEGSNFEDSGSSWDMLTLNARFFNHFHDPTRPWSSAGLDDWIIIPPYHVTGWSSILWAQDRSKQSTFPAGDWSWKTIREDFYIALTSKDFNGVEKAMTEQARNEYYAKLFRGLGHQMHLVQDAAVPDHVRNDAHWVDEAGLTPYYMGFETWASQNESDVNRFATNPVSSNISSLNPSQMTLDPEYNNRVLAPSALFIDTDQYNGSNPSTSLSIGLAEYTNANFFSNDTIFAAELKLPGDRHYFPYPKDTSTNFQDLLNEHPELVTTIIGEDNVTETAVWIKKTGDGEQIEHFLRLGYFGFTPAIRNGPEDQFKRTFYRDEKCHQDYAEKLVPRAVGYSAELIDYFFRGDIFLVEDSSAPNTYKINNNSSEDMDGTFELYYDGVLDQYGNQGADGELFRKPVTSLEGQTIFWQGLIPAGEEGGLFTIDNFPDDFPTDKEGEVFLVFHGTMGQEDDAVAGRKDKIGDLGEIGFYVREQSGEEYFRSTDGSLSDCSNPAPFLGSLTDYGQLLHVYQKKFSNGEESFYLIRQAFDAGHKVFVYDPGTGALDTLATYGITVTDVSFNASNDLQTIYIAAKYPLAIAGSKYIKSEGGWALELSQSWSASDPAYVKKDGTIVAIRWQNDDKQKVNLDIDTGSLSVVGSGLYSITSNNIDNYYQHPIPGCDDDTYSCRFDLQQLGLGWSWCGKKCDVYFGSGGSGGITDYKESFLYSRSGGTGDYIEELKEKIRIVSNKVDSHLSTHADCSEISDNTCSNSSDTREDYKTEYIDSVSFLDEKYVYNKTKNKYSSSSISIEKYIDCGIGSINCPVFSEVKSQSSNVSCDWNESYDGTNPAILWAGKDYWKLNSMSSGSRTHNSNDPYLCGNSSYPFDEWSSQSVSNSIDTPYGSISFGSSSPDQFVFFYLEDAYENNYIEGVKYHLDGTWYIKLYANGKPFDLLSCIGTTAEEFQFPILLN